MKKNFLLVCLFFLTACSPVPPKSDIQPNSGNTGTKTETQTSASDPSKADTECPGTYKPVCALIQVQCFRAPCPPLFETIENECLAKERGNMLLGYTSGQCEKGLGTVCKNDTDCQLPIEYTGLHDCLYVTSCVYKQCVVVCHIQHLSIN